MQEENKQENGGKDSLRTMSGNKCVNCLLAIAAVLLVNKEFAIRADSPQIIQQTAVGGSANDVPCQLKVLPDGKVVIGGESSSTNGNRTSPTYGAKDFWVVCLSSSGATAWERSFGGVGNDQLQALEVVRTNQMILAGGSSSPASGNKTTSNYGLRDFWVILIDANGEKLWERSFGGSDDDIAYSVAETADGGFIVGGYSRSPASGNKSAPCRGEGDFWVVKLDKNGNKLWDQSYGGAGDDGAFSLVPLPTGSVMVAGNSASEPGGNKRTGNFGYYDLWLLRLDAGGDIEWEKVYGGDSDDGYYSVSLRRTPGGDLILGADSFSGATGNKSSANFGQDDFWILRLDAAGNPIWEATCGGTDNDYLTSLLLTSDGGVVAGGGSNSGITGNKTAGCRGSTDFWLVKLDASGKSQWDKSLGGTDADAFMGLSLAQTTNGNVLCCGDSGSGANGDKTVPSWGATDFWLVALAAASAQAPSLSISLESGVPRVVLSGETGRTYVTDASGDLQAWNPVATNQLSSPTATVVDPQQALNSKRFYRARLVE